MMPCMANAICLVYVLINKEVWRRILAWLGIQGSCIGRVLGQPMAKSGTIRDNDDVAK